MAFSSGRRVLNSGMNLGRQACRGLPLNRDRAHPPFQPVGTRFGSGPVSFYGNGRPRRSHHPSSFHSPTRGPILSRLTNRVGGAPQNLGDPESATRRAHEIQGFYDQESHTTSSRATVQGIYQHQQIINKIRALIGTDITTLAPQDTLELYGRALGWARVSVEHSEQTRRASQSTMQLVEKVAQLYDQVRMAESAGQLDLDEEIDLKDESQKVADLRTACVKEIVIQHPRLNRHHIAFIAKCPGNACSYETKQALHHSVTDFLSRSTHSSQTTRVAQNIINALESDRSMSPYALGYAPPKKASPVLGSKIRPSSRPPVRPHRRHDAHSHQHRPIFHPTQARGPQEVLPQNVLTPRQIHELYAVRNWEELPEETIENLADQIINTIKFYSNRNPASITNAMLLRKSHHFLRFHGLLRDENAKILTAAQVRYFNYANGDVFNPASMLALQILRQTPLKALDRSTKRNLLATLKQQLQIDRRIRANPIWHRIIIQQIDRLKGDVN